MRRCVDIVKWLARVKVRPELEVRLLPGSLKKSEGVNCWRSESVYSQWTVSHRVPFWKTL